jgi:hypothetical protein
LRGAKKRPQSLKCRPDGYPGTEKESAQNEPAKLIYSGRLAVSHDGNIHDEDEWGALAFVWGIVASFGMQEKLVHVDHSKAWKWMFSREQKHSDVSDCGMTWYCLTGDVSGTGAKFEARFKNPIAPTTDVAVAAEPAQARPTTSKNGL